ncbi:MAG: hypothetical protein U1F37_16985 [Alphaproteobacteria bacterium]
MRRSPPLLAAVLALAACGDSTPTVDFAKACAKEHDGKTIATTGYLRAPFEGLCRKATRQGASITTCSFDLRDKADGEARLSLNIELGTGANRVDEAKLKARQGAAAIAASDGKFLAEKAHIRVTGVLTAVPNSLKPDETICWLDVAKIERR